MAYAHPFDANVTELRYQCLWWNNTLRRNRLNVDFNVFEFRANNIIDFEILLRQPGGMPLDRVRYQSIVVNDTLPDLIQLLVNIFLHRYGVQVN